MNSFKCQEKLIKNLDKKRRHQTGYCADDNDGQHSCEKEKSFRRVTTWSMNFVYFTWLPK